MFYVRKMFGVAFNWKQNNFLRFLLYCVKEKNILTQKNVKSQLITFLTYFYAGSRCALILRKDDAQVWYRANFGTCTKHSSLVIIHVLDVWGQTNCQRVS